MKEEDKGFIGTVRSDYEEIDRVYKHEDEIKLEKNMNVQETETRSSKMLARLPLMLCAILMYCMSAVSIVITNKYIYGVYKFPLNFLLEFMCTGTITIVMIIMKKLKVIECVGFRYQYAYYCMPMAILRTLANYTSTRSVKTLPVPTYVVLKNLNVVMVSLGEWYFFSARVTVLMWVSFLILITSSIISSSERITFDVIGYIWVLLNCLLVTALNLYVKYLGKNTGLKKLDFTYYHNIMSIIPALMFSLNFDNWKMFFTDYVQPGYLIDGKPLNMFDLLTCIAMNFVCVFVINYASYWCVSLVSLTTYSTVGALNKIPLFIAGMLFFPKDNEDMVRNVISIMVAVFGGLVYTLSRWLLLRERGKNDHGINDNGYDDLDSSPHNVEFLDSPFEKGNESIMKRR